MESEDYEDHEEEEEDEETAGHDLGYPPCYSPSPIAASAPYPFSPTTKKHPARYRECLKNHAAGIGRHAVDGCGEFLSAGPEGSADAFKCAACNCHRNFHRKEYLTDVVLFSAAPPTPNQAAVLYPYPCVPLQHPASVAPPSPPPAPHYNQHRPHSYQFYPHNRSTAPAAGAMRLALPPSTPWGGGTQSRGDGAEDEEGTGQMGGGAVGTSGGHNVSVNVNNMVVLGSPPSKKRRFRTKFTQEQKGKMLELAEQVGWRIQKQDEVAVRHFCSENGVQLQALKVWMHNNKVTLGKKP